MTPPPLPVLIVDDYPLLRHVLAAMLKRSYSVLTTSDGRTALEIIETTPVFAVVLDLDMPVMDGWEVLRHLRENPRFVQLPVVVLTVLTTRDELARATSLGVSAYLRKPAQIDRLVEVLHDIAHERHDREQASDALG